MIYSILLRYITTLPIKLLLAHLSICLDSIFHYVSKWKNCVKNFLKTFVGVIKRRKNRSKLLSFEFYSFMAFEFYSGGRGRKKFVVVVCRAIREKSIKKKNALYANGSGPDPPSSSDTSVTSPAFIDVFLPVRAARISSFPRALPPLPKLEPVSFFPSFQGDEIAGEELLDEPIGRSVVE